MQISAEALVLLLMGNDDKNQINNFEEAEDSVVSVTISSPESSDDESQIKVFYN